MSEHPPPATVALDADGRLAEDVACRQCGYSLRGLEATGACPECTLAVERSMRGNLLANADPAWVARLASGTLWIVIGSLASGVYGAGFFVLIAALMGANLPLSIASALGLVPALITVFGAWLLTTPDPGGAAEEGRIDARRVTRWCILAMLAATPLRVWGVDGITATAGFSSLSALELIVTSLVLIAAAVTLVGQLAGLWYLHRLAARIPATGLARQTRTVFWGYVVVGGAGVVLGLVTMIAGPAMTGLFSSRTSTGALGGAMLFIVAGGCAHVVATIVFVIWAIVLLIRYQVAFKEAALAAAAGWGDTAPGTDRP